MTTDSLQRTGVLSESALKARKICIAQLMRRDFRPAQINPGLFLGSVGAAYTKQTLSSLAITHILTVCELLPPRFPNVLSTQDFTYKVVDVQDCPDAAVSQYFDECAEFIDNAIRQGGRVLVHCFAGVSRSATVVIAYLQSHKGLSLQEAMTAVKSKRRSANPNIGFISQLAAYEQTLKNRRNSQ